MRPPRSPSRKDREKPDPDPRGNGLSGPDPIPWRTLGLVLLGLWLAACAPAGDWPPRLEGLPSRDVVARDYRVLGWSVEGRPIFSHVFGRGPETVLMVAGLHGNAPAGTRLLRQFMTHLVEHPELLDGRRVVIVPLLNPDGGVHATRFNARGVDLDRNFPAGNWQIRPRCGTRAASEPEIHALLLAIDTYSPTRILQLRSPLNNVSGPGQVVALARRMARASGFPYDPFPPPPASGSLAALARGNRYIPTIVFELDSRKPVPGQWKKIFPALELFIQGE